MRRGFTYIVLTMILSGIGISFYSCDDKEHSEAPKATPVVTTSDAMNITTNSAIVGGNIADAGNDLITKCGIVYSSNVAVPTIVDNKVIAIVTDGVFSASLTGLSSGTKYHIRAFATNSVGTSYGELIDFSTENAAPVISDLFVTGTVEIGGILTASYIYNDEENDAESGTIFQWYTAMDADGTGEAVIQGATAKTFAIQEAQNGSVLRVSVTPKAATGTAIGVEVKSTYTTVVGSELVTFVYNGETVSYGTIVSAKTQRKWLDRNLGATRVAQSGIDYLAFGDLFQWGRLADGHQLITRTGSGAADAHGVTGITSMTPPYEKSATDVPMTNKFIINGEVATSGDWRITPNNNLWQGALGINNPCPKGWRIATLGEWVAENIKNGPDGFNRLKVTYGGGYRSIEEGTINGVSFGHYWTSTRDEVPDASDLVRSIHISFTETQSGSAKDPRALGLHCRCIKD